jgi:hypothetical protein
MGILVPPIKPRIISMAMNFERRSVLKIRDI